MFAGGGVTDIAFEPWVTPFCTLRAVHSNAWTVEDVLDVFLRTVRDRNPVHKIYITSSYVCVLRADTKNLSKFWSVAYLSPNIYNKYVCVCVACRYNKRIKNLVRDVSHPEAHLATSATQDASASYLNLAIHNHYDMTTSSYHKCVLSVPKHNWYVTEEDLIDLAFLGLEQDQFSIHCFAVAHVLGVHFRAKEWNMYPRCGSVVTCVKDGQSCYARVKKFFQVDGDNCPGYASVSWFGKPTYPLGTPMVVKVSDDGSRVRSEYGCIISLKEIDPSKVMVEFSEEPETYYLMRDSGYDTIKK